MSSGVAVAVALALGASPAPERTTFTLRENVPFATAGSQRLRLDLAIPAGPGPHPLVVCVHGGAWKVGHRDHLTRGFWWYEFGPHGKALVPVLAERGFAAASVSYRLAPGGKAADQLDDVRAAVRHLREHAADYNLDPNRVALLGLSAGGHLAALAGTRNDDPATRVRCVVDYYGPTDLRLYCESPGLERAFMVPLVGCPVADNPEAYKSASPIEHVSADDPPFLILHGTADLMVPIVHSERFYTKLKAAGVPATMVTVAGAGHGFRGTDATTTTETVVKFLAEHLKAK